MWAYAWLADLVALGLALGFWYFQPAARYHHPIFAFYLAAKVAFVLLLLQGAWVLRGKSGWLLRNPIVLPAAALFSIITGFVVQNTDQLGLVTYPVLTLMLLAGVIPLARPLSSGTAWLAMGFLTRALLLVGETAAYAIRLVPERFPDLQAPIRLFISAASSFDSGAEWLIALGCVLAISNRIQRELRESNAELLAAQTLAEEANLSKSVFLSNMSHELRTPLNAVIGFAQLMARSRTLGPEDRESVAIIRRSGEHLLGLINEVLSISKIEAGKLVLQRRPFDPGKMILSVASMIRGRARDAGLELDVDLDPNLPAAVLGDEGKLRQALLNLIGNAVKFTPSGTVTIRARWSDGRAAFEVSDTGHGIAESELPHLFEPFVQTESGRQTREGTGLGLAITRQLVQLMGGEISVTSRLGVGTTFRFEASLPLAAEPVLPTEANRVVGFEAQGTPPRILVVDDTRDSRVLLRKLLETVGFRVDEATNGAEAVELWKEGRHALIFIDNRMPVMDGSEATEAIRRLEAEEGRAPTLIVSVTASVFEHERGTILARGADDVVMKPFAEEKIFEVISSRLGVRFLREGNPTGIDSQPVAEAGSETPPSALRVAEGLRRASGNAALYREVLRSFRDDYADAVAGLRSMHGDDEAISMLLHSLRGSAATIGATGLAAETNVLEASLRAGEALTLDPFILALGETMAAIDMEIEASAPAADAPPSMSPEPWDAESLRSHKRRLDALLMANDLSALECYRELKERMGTPLGPAVLRLGNAIEALDFETARARLLEVETSHEPTTRHRDARE